MTHEPPHNAALPKTPFAKLCFSIAALEPFQPDILGSYRDGYTAAKNAALALVEDSALVSLLNAAPPDPRKDLAALEEAQIRLDEAEWWDDNCGFPGRGAKMRANRLAELEQRLAEMRGAKR